MPTPSAGKTDSATADRRGDRVTHRAAHERRGAGRGDDHGEYAGEKLPRQSVLRVRLAAGHWRCRPAAERELEPPSRLSPMTNNSMVRLATTQGVCSWKPQPSALPAPAGARSAARRAARTTAPRRRRRQCRARPAVLSASDAARDRSASATARQHAGHQVQDQPAEERRAQRRDQRHGGRGGSPEGVRRSPGPPCRPPAAGRSKPIQPPRARSAIRDEHTLEGPGVSAFTGWAAVRYSAVASPSRFSTCGAAGSIRPSGGGKNSSRLAVLPAGNARLA